MTSIITQHDRKASHGLHRCGYCGRNIGAGSQYLDQRLADGGQAYTFRAHHACVSAFWSWFDRHDEPEGTLQDASGGHLPPCQLAWSEEARDADSRCSCAAAPMPGQVDIFGGVA